SVLRYAISDRLADPTRRDPATVKAVAHTDLGEPGLCLCHHVLAHLDAQGRVGRQLRERVRLDEELHLDAFGRPTWPWTAPRVDAVERQQALQTARNRRTGPGRNGQ